MSGGDALHAAVVAAFLAHETDATRRRERRILPVLRSMPERAAAELFVRGHVPLVAPVLVASGSEAFRLGLAAFALVHVWPRCLLRRHPENGFNNPYSWALILLTGAARLLAALR